MDFLKVARCLDSIAVAPGSIAKTQLLRQFAQVDGFKDVLKFIYDPYHTTGLKAAKLEGAGIAATILEAEDMMEYLMLNTTGKLVDAMLANAFIYCTPFDASEEDCDIWRWAAMGLVTKDLQIGVSVTTLNSVYGKAFIPKIGIMRGMPCPDGISGDYIATEKIDGNRRLIFVHDNDRVEIFTRSGHRDDGLPEVVEAAKKLPVGFVYDCECVAMGSYSDNIALRQASASLLNARGQRHGVKALCFDMLPIHEYEEGRSSMNGFGRKLALAATMGDKASCELLLDWVIDNKPTWVVAAKAMAREIADWNSEYIQCLPILGVVHNKEDGIEMAKPIWDAKGEGIMMLEVNSAYEVNPNPRKTLLKIKASQEFVCRCVGLEAGDNKYANTLGAIIVDYVKNGVHYDVKVGSGFTDYQRYKFYLFTDKILGKMVEIECFGESQNAKGGWSLNCPIFKRVVGDND